MRTLLARTVRALTIVVAAIASLTACQSARENEHARRTAKLREVLERFRRESRFPGAVGGAWLAGDSSTIVVAVGLADRDAQLPMTPESRLHAGSVGKTLFAALALQLVGEGRIALNERVSHYLGKESWFVNMPNSATMTVRMLLNHTSGVPEYGYDFMVDLVRNPGRERTPLDAVKSVAGAKPKAVAGRAFSYSDVNYQILQLLLERVTGASAYREIDRRLLRPLQLSNIVPADRPRIPGLVQGYAGSGSFMGYDAVMSDGALILHPAFEGGGGGFVTNAGDLARWMALFAESKVFPRELLVEVRRGVPAGQKDVGANALSGLGVDIVQTPLGVAYGHGGFFPGYLSAVLWYPQRQTAVAVQVNSSASNALGRPLRDVLLDIAHALSDSI